jgi:hypothetical protein
MMGLWFCKAYITTEKEEYEDMLKESGNLIIGIRPILSIIWIFDSYNTTSRWIFHKGVYPAAEILGPTSRPVCSLAVFLIMDENESFIEVEYIEGGGLQRKPQPFHVLFLDVNENLNMPMKVTCINN